MMASSPHHNRPLGAQGGEAGGRVPGGAGMVAAVAGRVAAGAGMVAEAAGLVAGASSTSARSRPVVTQQLQIVVFLKIGLAGHLELGGQELIQGGQTLQVSGEADVVVLLGQMEGLAGGGDLDVEITDELAAGLEVLEGGPARPGRPADEATIRSAAPGAAGRTLVRTSVFDEPGGEHREIGRDQPRSTCWRWRNSHRT